jgi:hypothetical protein
MPALSGVMLGVMDKREGGEWAPLSALPDRAPEGPVASSRRLSCDGETFELRSDQFGATHYTWLSGPNPGYGFTASAILPAATPSTIADTEQHQTNIRRFLAMIDPETGYIEED